MSKTKADLSSVAFDKGRATDRYNARNTATVTGQPATPEALPASSNEEDLLQKLFQVKRRAIRQFDILKGEEGRGAARDLLPRR